MIVAVEQALEPVDIGPCVIGLEDSDDSCSRTSIRTCWNIYVCSGQLIPMIVAVEQALELPPYILPISSQTIPMIVAVEQALELLITLSRCFSGSLFR